MTLPNPPQGVQYGGRRLDVSLALSREEVEKVKDSASGRMGKVDKRNLYLAKEGGELSTLISVRAWPFIFCASFSRPPSLPPPV